MALADAKSAVKKQNRRSLQGDGLQNEGQSQI